MKQESTSTQNKPVLGEETFQQLLAAANMMQQHNERLLVKKPKADYTETLSVGAIAENVRPSHVVPLTPETLAHPVASPKPKVAHLARLAYRYRALGNRSSLTDKLVWKAATVVAVTSVSALLLGATIYRFSPLPAGLALSSEVVQQQVPFQRTKRVATLPASIQKPIVRPIHLPTNGSEADIVAEDTAVRYGTRSAAPRLPGQKKP